MKAYKVKISGSYQTNNKEYIDFADIGGTIPYCSEDDLPAMLLRRYAWMWLKDSPVRNKSVVRIRECYIDSLEECDAEFSFVGKDIKDMDAKELQDLAVAKQLREIPIYKKTSLREAQIKAYSTYSKYVLKEDVDVRGSDFNLHKAPPIIVDGSWRKGKATDTQDIEKVFSAASKPSADDMAKLKEVANDMGMKYHPNISYEKLHSKVYG